MSSSSPPPPPAPPSSPPPPPPFPDLNLSLNLIQPKAEPSDDPSPDVGINPHLVPEVHTPLQQVPPSSAEEAALFSEYFRLAHLFLASCESAAPPPPPPPQPRAMVPAAAAGPTADPPAGGPTTALAVPVRKRPPRSTELVRVSSIGPRDRTYFRDVVRRARTTFESLRALLHRDEAAAAAARAAAAPGRRAPRRADLRAASLMGDRALWLNRDRRIVGTIPGIDIGDVFFFRMELCVVGLHGQVQAGIDHVPAGRSASGEPVATSVIVSGGYEDDDDAGETLVYTGHGGRDRNLHRLCGNQKLEGGNLALERSMHHSIEIRVVRGVKSDVSPTGKVYVYDGLYKIVDCWQDVGKSGFSVYKYRMLRLDGQDEMGSTLFKLAEEIKANALAVRPTGYLTLDMSMGRENSPVSVFNDIDDDRDPLFYEYLARPIYPPSASQEKGWAGGGGCDCVSVCTPAGCYCAKLNGGDFPYNESGILFRGKPVIYECGPSCHCPPTCLNRVSQKGLMRRLEVFRSRETGWGVRSLDLIRAGSFVCELSGIVLTKQQAEVVSMNGDSLVCPSRFPPRWMDWGDISDVFPDYVPPGFPTLPELTFSIDVSRTRNVACYLSHSCSPNVFVQFVLFDHYNVLYPHLMIFAMENIPPLRELSIDYGVTEEWVGRLTM